MEASRDEISASLHLHLGGKKAADRVAKAVAKQHAGARQGDENITHTKTYYLKKWVNRLPRQESDGEITGNRKPGEELYTSKITPRSQETKFSEYTMA